VQVEHPVTEWIAEVNLPAAQLGVCMGIPLWRMPGMVLFAFLQLDHLKFSWHWHYHNLWRGRFSTCFRTIRISSLDRRLRICDSNDNQVLGVPWQRYGGSLGKRLEVVMTHGNELQWRQHSLILIKLNL
jgi:hypothetical protein